MDSPSKLSVRSQASMDDEIEMSDAEGSQYQPGTSQAQFLTQVPCSGQRTPPTQESIHQVSITENVNNAAHTISNQTNLPSEQDFLKSLFIKKQGSQIEEPNVQPRSLVSSPTETALKPRTMEHRTAPEIEDEDQEDLPNVELITADDTDGMPQPELLEGEGKTPRQEVDSLPEAPLPNMPAAMIELMRAFRTESSNGRYLPRCIQIIPMNQRAIIESDDSWQPPLVGRQERPGLVPLELMNTLTEEADRTSKEKLDLDHETSEERRESQATKEGSAEGDGAEDVSLVSSQSTEEEATEWSDSEHSEYPPDSHSSSSSSPKSKEVSDLPSRGDIPCESEHKGSSYDSQKSCQDGSNLNDVSTRTEIHEPYLSDDSRSRMPPPGSKKHPRADDEDIYEERPSRLKASIAPSHKEVSTGISRKTVQVDRTPITLKGLAPSAQSTTSPTFIVPGTFDERTKQISTTHALEAHVQTDPNSTDNDDDSHSFEHDSSEDEVVHSQADIHPISHTPHVRRTRLEITDDRKAIPSARISVASTRATSERRDVLVHDALSEPNPKRRKVTSHNSNQGLPATKTEYAAIDEYRRRERRGFYHQHHHSRRTEAIESSAISRSDRIASGMDADVENDNSQSKRLPTGANPDDIVTHSNKPVNRVMSNVLSNANSAPLQISTVRSTRESGGASKLFSEYKTTYADYQGEEKHFNAACKLLKSLHLKAKATHPSLWDDFIFRHFHDYRIHLYEVMENSGNALPYEVFYETNVEEPTHLKRVVRPTNLDNLSAVPLPRAEFFRADDSSTTDHILQLDRQPIESYMQSKNDALLVKEDTEELHRSQRSSQSVRAWLERAVGAESPELGSPEANDRHQGDVPPLEIRAISRTRLIPKQAQVHLPASISSSAPAKLKTTFTIQSAESKAEPTSFKKTVQTPIPSNNTLKPGHRPKEPKPAPNFTRSPQAQVESTTLQRNLYSKQPRPKISSSTRADRLDDSAPKPSPITRAPHVKENVEPDTVFRRFVRDYNSLACERSAR